MLQLVSSLYWPLFCTLHIYIISLHPRMQSIPGYRKAFSSNSQYALGRLLRSHSQHKNQLEAKALGVPVCTGVGLSYIHLHNQNAPRGKTKQSVWFKWTKHCTCENSIKAALKIILSNHFSAHDHSVQRPWKQMQVGMKTTMLQSWMLTTALLTC